MNRTRILVVGSLTALVVACGGSSPPEASAPSSTPAEPAPQTIEEAQAQIASAKDQLGGGAPGASSTKSTLDAAPPKNDAEPAPPPAADAPASTEKPADACMSPCRALASMRRAVDALCRMAGDSDKRCLDARQTLSDSVSRTATCKCAS